MKKVISIWALSLLLISAGCVNRTNEGEKARADYKGALGDSIEVVKAEIDSCNANISLLRDQVGVWLRDFTTISNPREVGSYIIYTPMKDKYPSRSTALMARINDSGQYELIATLTGKTFDQIEVSVPNITMASEVVPHDQALNFRNAGLTTVLFSGAKADSIGQIIADNELNPITVTYRQGGAVQHWKMPSEYSKMVSYTWMLYDAQSRLHRLEQRVPMLHEKINLLRSHIDHTEQADSAK